MNFYGYVRKDGKVGARNYIAVIPMVFCVNEVVEAIVSNTMNTKSLCHHQGCCQLPPDLERVTKCLIGLGKNPNVAAVLLVSLGCEGTDLERVSSEIADSGKPVEIVRVQQGGGMANAIADGIKKVQKMQRAISGLQRCSVDISHYVMSIKCGASDATSGLASNCVIGYIADRMVDDGATVIFGETTEFIGAEHILARRAANAEVENRLYEIVDRMETRAKSLGTDMRKGQPTPGNIMGGLTTIEDKSIGAIMKSGSRTIRGVLEYPDIACEKGLWIKDTPGREMEILTGMAISGSQCMLFSTGRGAPQGFSIMPVLKICGNPETFERMKNDMDINAGTIIRGEKSVEEVAEIVLKRLIKVLNGEATKSEAMNYNKSCDFYMQGPVI